MIYSFYYIGGSGQIVSAAGLTTATGLDPASPPSVLSANGVYPVLSAGNPYDPGLYQSAPSYTINGDFADQSWVATPLPLATAQANGIVEVKEQAGDAEQAVLEANSVTVAVMTAVSSQLVGDRPAPLQAIVAEMQVVSDNLGTNITNIEAATTVDEINNIVNKPSGIIFTGRGSGLGPQDLNVSYYTAFNSVSMTESETELYVPGTSTTIAYGSGGSGQFDSMGNCFNPGDYLLQIRETATSMVIAEFECPLAPAGVDVSF